DAIWFMPSPSPPHKTGMVITTAHHRIEMVKMAIADNDRFFLSLAEFAREGPSYTYDTVRTLISEHPEFCFFFIVGADMVENLPSWHQADELIRLVPFIGVGRPGFSLDSKYADHIWEVDIPEFAMS